MYECKYITVAVIYLLYTVIYCTLSLKRDCEKEIDWYQSVKETQGSVEVTSFGQMRNINQLGQYTIGSTKRGINANRADVIHLKLVETRRAKRLPKVQYTLDELRDLESKLVLITGGDLEECNKVDQFLKVSLFI